MIKNAEILKELKSIRIRAELVIESTARLEEKLAGEISTSPSKLNDKKIQQAVDKMSARIKAKSKIA